MAKLESLIQELHAKVENLSERLLVLETEFRHLAESNRRSRGLLRSILVQLTPHLIAATLWGLAVYIKSQS